jgi:transposase
MESEKEDPTDKVLEKWDGGERNKRGLARRLGLSVKRVRKILEEHERDAPKPQSEVSKLAGFEQRIAELWGQGLTKKRILATLQEEGYQGKKTILGEHIDHVHGKRPRPHKAKVVRRFETAPAEEMQVDWTTHRVSVAGTLRVVHFFAAVLAWSRHLFVGAYRNEQLPTLLAAHAEAFAWFEGVTRRVVYDNMATVTLGRRARQVLWHPRLLEFARHWMYEPFVCRVRDPNRKGRVESAFPFHDQDFLRGRVFGSWDELERAQQEWLAGANRRVHGTTRQVPFERWQQERPLLTRPPAEPFPTYREEVRSVYHDCTIGIAGGRYSVPAQLARTTVTVRVHLRHIEVLDARGQIQARHAIAEPGQGLVIDPAHYESIRRGPATTQSQLEQRFLKRFPGTDEFLAGLRRRHKGLVHVHVRQVERLALVYGVEATARQIALATAARRFSATAIARMLARELPLRELEPQPWSVTASAEANRALIDEAEEVSAFDYPMFHDDEDDDDDALPCGVRR